MDVTKGLAYYTDNRCEEKIASSVRTRLREVGYPIVSVSHKPLPGFGKNIVVDMVPGILTMFRQILIGLEASESDIVFLTEHDVLYDPSHFEFTPFWKHTFYYNINTQVVNAKTKECIPHNQKQTAGLCAYRKLLIEHYRKRVAIFEKDPNTYIEFEPGMAKSVDNHKTKTWMSAKPNIDIRHGNNLTAGRFFDFHGGAKPSRSNVKRN